MSKVYTLAGADSVKQVIREIYPMEVLGPVVLEKNITVPEEKIWFYCIESLLEHYRPLPFTVGSLADFSVSEASEDSITLVAEVLVNNYYRRVSSGDLMSQWLMNNFTLYCFKASVTVKAFVASQITEIDCYPIPWRIKNVDSL